MKLELLRYLRCSNCAGTLSLCQPGSAVEVDSGALACAACGHTYPIVRSVPRFAPSENYTSSFGFQWQQFRRTQLDSHTGVPISKTRFYAETDWTPAELNGALVLDAGCGAGRFTEVALEAGATVVAIDYSEAVDACWANHAGHPRLHVVQADLYRLPFDPGTFDFVYSLGVLQHTPDVERALKALVAQVKGDGRIAIDLYPATPLNLLWPKYWFRPLTKRLPPRTLFRLVKGAVPWLLPISLVLGRIPLIGGRLRYLVPVVNYDGKLPLSADQLREWAVLDTFDMFAPAHDHPQLTATVRRWFAEMGFEHAEVWRRGLVVGRARKPAVRDASADDRRTPAMMRG